MTVSDKQLQEYATYMCDHPAKDALLERIDATLVKSFRYSTDEERIQIIKIMDSIAAVFDEFEVIKAEGMEIYTDKITKIVGKR